MRKRRGIVDLEVAGDDDDEEEELDENIRDAKGKIIFKKKHKRRRKHSLFFHLTANIRQGFEFLQLYSILSAAWQIFVKRANNLTPLQLLGLGVLVIFVQVPLLLFMFTERKVIHEKDIHYNIYNCPSKPVQDYPREYPIGQVLHHWPSANLSVPLNDRTHHIHKGICVFDIGKDAEDAQDDLLLLQTIQRYRTAQVPFIIRNDPNVLHAVRLWSKNNNSNNSNNPEESPYLSNKLGASTEYPAVLIDSKNSDKESYSTYTPMSWKEWGKIALEGSQAKEKSSLTSQYASLRLDACSFLDDDDHDNHKSCQAFLNEDLNFLKPKNKKNKEELQVYDTSGTVHCYLQSPGFLTETRLDDQGGNYVVMLGGSQRYILAHPRNCQTLYLKKEQEQDDTSTYHQSQIHLKNFDLSRITHQHQIHYNHPYHPSFAEYFPDFEKTTVNEVVLEAGDVLYLPTHWVHHAIALSTSNHCDAVSGHSKRYQTMVDKCLKKYGVEEDKHEQ